MMRIAVCACLRVCVCVYICVCVPESGWGIPFVAGFGWEKCTARETSPFSEQNCIAFETKLNRIRCKDESAQTTGGTLLEHRILSRKRSFMFPLSSVAYAASNTSLSMEAMCIGFKLSGVSFPVSNMVANARSSTTPRRTSVRGG